MQRNYPDKLKQRRKPAKELDNREGLYLTTGKALTVEERDREVFVELIASRNYYDKGLQLIAKHYGIAASVPKSVIVDFVLPPDGAFWRELALKLLMDKVPYFQSPGRPGAKATLRAVMPFIDATVKRGEFEAFGMTLQDVLKALKLDRAPLPTSEPEILVKFAEALRIDPESVRREFKRWRVSAGGNSKE